MAVAIIGGLIVLVWGADFLVRGASQLAFSIGISPLVVGLTVVAFGTSAPELAVSVQAALAGEAGVGLGNVFGSNIANVLLILGLSAMLMPLAVSKQLIRVDVPVMILVTAATIFFSYDGLLSRGEGVSLVGGLVVYIGLQLRLAKVKSDDREEQGDVVDGSTERSSVEEQKGSEVGESAASDGDGRWVWRHLGLALIRCVVGLVMLVVGAHYLVDGAVQLATMWGVSEVIIGLTVIAIGTSLPEVVTSIVASLRGQRDLSVGNVVGSNLFNILAVLGISVIVSPRPIEVQKSLLQFDMPVMMLASVICLPIFMTGKGVSRLEGLLLFLSYLAYVGYQIYIVAQFPK